MSCSASAQRRIRTSLAIIRTALLYVAAWGVLTAGLLVLRSEREAGVGTVGELPATSSPVYDLPLVGINVALEQYAEERPLQERLDLLRSAGFGWARQRFGWDQIEPEQGGYEWDNADRILRGIVQAGLEPVVVLDGSPAWSRTAADNVGSGNHLAPPEDFQDFAQFAGAFASRYRDSVRFYQVWDEPNIAPHWGDRWIDPVGYAQMVRSASQAIRKADPDAVIILGALAPTDDRGHLAIDEVFFLQRLLAAGAGQSFDAVALQPLGFGDTPENRREGLGIYNFHRAVAVRRALVQAGADQIPIIAARFGWNRQPGSPWGTVTDVEQRTFAVRALDLAYSKWPWMAAMAWAIDIPSSRADDAAWGFSLDQPLVESISRWVQGPRTVAAERYGVPSRAWSLWTVLALASAALIWRLSAAQHVLPWQRWRDSYLALPFLARAAIWALLLAVYMVAAWPPLIILCWIAASILVRARPQHGLWLAAAVTPFYFYHKEIDWGGFSLTVAPVVAATVCLAPALARKATRFRASSFDRWDGVAVAWLIVISISALGVWYWPAFYRGAVELAVTPLILFWAVREFTASGKDRRSILIWLVAGGVLVAILGVREWLGGSGTWADGVQRLTGPYYSANHAALYLLRTLFCTLGLALYYPRPNRRIYGFCVAFVAVALVLTASRAAIALGVPAGLAALGMLTFIRRRQNHAVADARLLAPQGVALAVLTICVAAALIAMSMGWERLTNSATVILRWELWRTSFGLFRDYWATGTGPNGFFWQFPAYIPVGSRLLDPNLLHPHNLWLEFATLGGIWGLLWLVAAVGIVVRGVLRAIADRRPAPNWPALGILAALVAALAHAQADAFAALPDLAAWNWISLGLLAAGLSPRQRVMRQD